MVFTATRTPDSSSASGVDSLQWEVEFTQDVTLTAVTFPVKWAGTAGTLYVDDMVTAVASFTGGVADTDAVMTLASPRGLEAGIGTHVFRIVFDTSRTFKYKNAANQLPDSGDGIAYVSAWTNARWPFSSGVQPESVAAGIQFDLGLPAGYVPPTRTVSIPRNSSSSGSFSGLSWDVTFNRDVDFESFTTDVRIAGTYTFKIDGVTHDSKVCVAADLGKVFAPTSPLRLLADVVYRFALIPETSKQMYYSNSGAKSGLGKEEVTWGNWVEAGGQWVAGTLTWEVVTASTVAVGQALEIDEATPIAYPASVQVGQASEVETAEPISVITPSAYALAVLADNPVAYYRMGETSGTVMEDASGNGRDGTYTNPPTLGTTGLVDGDVDTAAHFDGANDHARVTSAAWMDTAQVSVEALFNPDVTTGAVGTLVSRVEGASSADHIYMLRMTGHPAFQFWVATVNGSNYLQTSNFAPVAGETYHVVGTYDGATMCIYINGVLNNSMAHTGALRAPTAAADIYIGANQQSLVAGDSFADGVVDEVAVYNTALSLARVEVHRNAALGAPPQTVTIGQASELDSAVAIAGGDPPSVPTRFYLAATGIADISPAFDSFWDQTTGAIRRPLPTTPSNTSATPVEISEVSTSILDLLHAQFVSQPLPNALTISGTFSCILRCLQFNADAEMYLQARVRVVSGDGLTERGVLFAGQAATVASVDPSSSTAEYDAATYKTRAINAAPVTPVAAQAGDRILVELGSRACNTSDWWMAAYHTYGGGSGWSDYAITEVDSSGSKRGWVELSQELFPPPPQVVAVSQALETEVARAFGQVSIVDLAGEGSLADAIAVAQGTPLVGQVESTEVAQGITALGGATDRIFPLEQALEILSVSAVSLALGIGRSSEADVADPLTPTVVVTASLNLSGEGVLAITSEQILTEPVVALEILDPELRRAPTALTFTLTGYDALSTVELRIGPEVIWTGETNTDGAIGATSAAVPDLLAGTHTVTAWGPAMTDLSVPAGTMMQLASETFTLQKNPVAALVVAGMDAQAVEIPGAVTHDTRHWVFQDLMPELDGGLGSYILPINPNRMTSPHLEHAMSGRHTVAHDGQYHVWQAGAIPKEWEFSGYCPSREMQEALERYRDLNRRFYIIDHRNRAWKVVLTNADFVPRLRHVFNDVLTDWGSDYTITATIFSQEWVTPA